MSAVDADSVSLATKVRANEWRIGFVLIRSGRLKTEDVVPIIERQRQTGQRFGAAAIDLGILRENDIRFALAQQFDYPYAIAGESKFCKSVVAAYEPHSATAESLRALRSQLTLRWCCSDGASTKALAVVSPDRGCGRSWLAANLAVTFSQLGKATVLVDGDLRHSTQHRLFGLENRQGLSEILCARALPGAVLKRNKVLPNLSVITAGATPPNPQEVIARDEFAELLNTLRVAAEIVIIDTPADSEAKDGQIIAKYAGGALLMAKRNASKAAQLSDCISSLRATGTDLLLSVLVD
jgi:protein-tyrosine kinase